MEIEVMFAALTGVLELPNRGAGQVVPTVN